MDKKKYVIIVAGGKGLRMGGEVPKQFQCLGDLPVLMHTINRFYHTISSLTILLVLPSEQHLYWDTLCKEYSFQVPVTLVAGGETRFHSVQNGVSCITDIEALVAVHDGVRPFVSSAVIEHCFEMANAKRAVVPVVDLVDSIRERIGSGSKTVNRNQYKLVQTPQVFQADLLIKAYQQSYNDSFTDDASVVEAMGEEIYLVQGNRENIKLTTPFDWVVAKAMV
ncbi:MAG: 2-C-methyl-D-erythritol 4-phosphate cytidylyltransferase [Bacteroidaceae bacterium]|nr:2-C-methyl-D-erythritol 4-phosphate cytidylyltransferase [Bacteroidaceae bacterium]